MKTQPDYLQGNYSLFDSSKLSLLINILKNNNANSWQTGGKFVVKSITCWPFSDSLPLPYISRPATEAGKENPQDWIIHYPKSCPALYTKGK